LPASSLGAVALLHLYWGFGGVWPGKSRRALTSLVFGGSESSAFPGFFACLAVSLGLFAAAALALQLGSTAAWVSPWWVKFAASGFIALFLVRGAGGFAMHRMAQFKDSPDFNHWNRRLYSPFCILAAAAYGVLLGLCRF
jgi:hypothetical protein